MSPPVFANSDCQPLSSDQGGSSASPVHRQDCASIKAGIETSPVQGQDKTHHDPLPNPPSVPVPLHTQDHSASVLPPKKFEVLQNSTDGRAFPQIATRNSPDLTACDAPSQTPDRFWFRCSSAFFALFTSGWGDGLTGTILPHIKSDFDISYMKSSLLFVTSTFGFALGVIMIEQVMCLLGTIQLSWIEFPRPPKSRDSRQTRKTTRTPPAIVDERRKGDRQCSPARARFRVLVIGSILHASFFVLMGTATGLSNVLIAYFVASLGKAFINGTNAYVTTSPKRPLGQMYACNSIGAFAAPLVCQTLLARGIPWTHFYLGSLVLSAINTTLLALAFRPTRNDDIKECIGISTEACIEAQSQSRHLVAGLTDGENPTFDRSGTVMSEKILDPGASPLSPSFPAEKDRSCLRFVLKLRHVWAFSFFMLIYSGSETSTQGYMATYLLAVRNGNPNTVGYVTSGFWGGMAISRFITGLASPYLGFSWRKHTIHFLLIFALSMHLCIWFINSIFENALSTGVIGLLYGPVYPSVLALAVDMMPKEAHMLAMAIIAGFANLGSSIFPFTVGALSNLRGPKVLVYLTVSQTAVLIILWMFFPAKSPFRHY